MMRFIYKVNYQASEKELCLLELRSLFKVTLQNKVMFSDEDIHPTTSLFLKNRLEIIYKTSSYIELLERIFKDNFGAQDFLVKYVSIESEDTHIKKAKKLSKKIGLIMHGNPSFKSPKIVFGVTHYEGQWYFGKLESSVAHWDRHKTKPHSYSSSLNINVAKALVNIAGGGDTTLTIVDPCCGVGTVLIEAFAAGYQIDGNEINEKIAQDARLNLEHFCYDVSVTTGDIKDITKQYDVAIVDLPYGISSDSEIEDRVVIVKNASKIAEKIVLVSSEDIRDVLVDEGYDVIEFCKIRKTEKRVFSRYIWVCKSRLL